MSPESLAMRNSVIKILSKFSVKSMLDLGCGVGELSLLYAKAVKANDVYAVDISQAAINEARRRGIKAFVCDLNCDKLPFDDNFFDLVTATEVLEHLYNPDNALEEVRRVLKPHGYFLVSTPNLSAWHSRVSLLLGYQPYQCEVSFRCIVGTIVELEGACGHIRAFTLRALKRLLEKYGFRVCTYSGSPSEHLPSVRKKLGVIPMLLDNLFSKFPSLAGHIIILSKKNA
jgi:methionine biosynthesis protein MetW